MTVLFLTLCQQLRQRMDTLGLIPSWKLDNDQFMVRYYRAGGSNLEKAEKMLKFYAEYCKDVNAESLYTEKFPIDFKDQYFAYVGGHDRDGRPSKLRICREKPFNIKLIS